MARESLRSKIISHRLHLSEFLTFLYCLEYQNTNKNKHEKMNQNGQFSEQNKPFEDAKEA